MTKIKMAQPTKPGNAERGWNDPPMFLHTPGATAPPPPPTGGNPMKRAPLTKRVAHQGLYGGAATSNTQQPPGGGPPPAMQPPINHGQAPPLAPPPGSAAPPPSVILLPPANTTELPKFTAPIIVPTMSPTEKQDLSIIGSPVATNPVTNMPVNAADNSVDAELSMPNFDNDQQLYHYVVTRLHKTLRDCHASLEAKEIEDCGRRLGTLAAMWEQGELSYPVKSAMARLATALHRRKCDMAHQIHLALMFDHVSEVSQWMVGVKRLIGAARGLDPPVCPTDSTAEELALLRQQSNDNDNSQMENANSQEENPSTQAETPSSQGKNSNSQMENPNSLVENSNSQAETNSQDTKDSNTHENCDGNTDKPDCINESPATLPVDTEQVMVASSAKVEEENSENL